METAYRRLAYRPPEVAHAYGPRVHILAHPTLLTRLARACSPECDSRELVEHVRALYREMAAVVAGAEFPRREVQAHTRMRRHHREGCYEGDVIDPRTRVVSVSIARAGLIPAQTLYEEYSMLLGGAGVRQDHIFANRRTDSDGRVVGVDLGGSKIGGSIHGVHLLVPDPMGATGGSIAEVLAHYHRRKTGKPKKVLTLHLIVTPEYLRRIRDEHPETIVYAVRLDRGLSPAAVLRRKPGERWTQERGLNDRHYIVPGGGGLGELLNNAEQ